MKLHFNTKKIYIFGMFSSSSLFGKRNKLFIGIIGTLPQNIFLIFKTGHIGHINFLNIGGLNQFF